MGEEVKALDNLETIATEVRPAAGKDLRDVVFPAEYAPGAHNAVVTSYAGALGWPPLSVICILILVFGYRDHTRGKDAMADATVRPSVAGRQSGYLGQARRALRGSLRPGARHSCHELSRNSRQSMPEAGMGPAREEVFLE